MITDAGVIARITVTDEFLAYGHDAKTNIRTALVNQVIAKAEEHAVMIRDTSVRVARSAEKAEVPMASVWVGYWYPDPWQGCLFLGGPSDGAMQAIDYSDAPQMIVFPYLGDAPAWIDDTAPSAPLSTRHVEYELAGKDSEKDCWVYLYRGDR